MKSNKRNRSEGWKQAKRSGHEYEQEFAKRVLDAKSDEYSALMLFAEKRGIQAKPISVDAKKGTQKVEDFTGSQKTQSKTDAVVLFENGDTLNLSLKKSSVTHGQAHLTTLQRFLDRITFLCGEKIPEEVTFVFKAFTGETDAKNIIEFAPEAKLKSPIIKKHNQQAELYQNRLYISTIQESYSRQWKTFQEWLRNKMSLVTHIVLSSGYAKNERDFADAIYYAKANQFFDLKEIQKLSAGYTVEKRDSGYYAGSTLTMPWGYLQLHRPGRKDGPYQLQFHHNYTDIIKLTSHK
ncbi:MAG: hypothetical protein SNJ55_04580 [Chloroherpetonaceae bacterium]